MKPLLALLLSLTAAIAHGGQVYVCREGAVTLYSTQPCTTPAVAATTAPASLAAAPVQAPAKVVSTTAPRELEKSADWAGGPAAGSVAEPWARSYLWVLMVVVVLFNAGKIRDLFRKKAAGPSIAPESRWDDAPPYKLAPVMSQTEIRFFDHLRQSLPDCEVFPQVPLAAFIRIDRQKAGDRWALNSYRWQNRLGQQRVDYLVCERGTYKVLAAIELDDASHDAAEAKARDAKKEGSLAAAGVALVRWQVAQQPGRDEIRAAILGQEQRAA